MFRIKNFALTCYFHTNSRNHGRGSLSDSFGLTLCFPRRREWARLPSMKPGLKPNRLTFCLSWTPSYWCMRLIAPFRSRQFRKIGHQLLLAAFFAAMAFSFICVLGAPRLNASTPQRDSTGPGFVQELPAPLRDVQQALDEVLEDQTIQGTYIFDRDRTLTGAQVVSSTPLFDRWAGAGTVFYKIRADAIAPRHFLNSADQGTIAVRYIVTSLDANHTRLRIDAVFVESSRRTVHPSDGTVESSEFKVFQEHLHAIEHFEQEALEAKRRRDSSDLVRQTLAFQHEDESTRLSAAQSSVQDLEQRVHSLRQEVERRVKAPGTDLKAAPFRSAAKVATLSAYTDVVVMIVTPHWYGVETPDGQHGWLPLDQLESLP
jgi:hypothetical protein